ncbi:hypothetical protein HanIR_Chr12g0590331 [Helianthus annuus]|nr:hypothetical protein HanIR_Chr12g0590331 [Helianthus annuus]
MDGEMYDGRSEIGALAVAWSPVVVSSENRPAKGPTQAVVNFCRSEDFFHGGG